MIAGLLYGVERPILVATASLVRESVEAFPGGTCRLAVCQGREELERAAAEDAGWDFACVDIGNGSQLARAEDLRHLCPEASLMLLVAGGVSPMAYIRPGIMPSCVVERTAGAARARKAVEEFITYLLERNEAAEVGKTPGDSQSFSIETRDGTTRVPFRSILCFESRAKRISVRLRREEYAYYDTLDRLEDALPPEFVRCHRGYIVNVSRVRRLSLSAGELVLDDGSCVPVSRSYKARVKERLS